MSAQSPKVLVALSLVFLILLSPNLRAEPAKPPEQTWSKYLRRLENNPMAIQELFHDENHRTNARLKPSKNRALLKAWFKDSMNNDSVTASEKLSDGSRLELVDHGLGRATELVRRNQDKRDVLLSNLTIKRNNTVSFIDLSVSPDEKIAVVFASENGSTDQYRLYFFDLPNKEIVSDQFVSRGLSLTWTGPEKFVFRPATKLKARVEIDAANGMAASELQGVAFRGSYPILFRCEKNEGKVIFDGSRSVNLAGFTCGDDQTLVHRAQDEIVGIEDSAHPTLWRYVITPDATEVNPEKLFEFNGVFQNATYLDQHYFIQTAWGPEQRLLVLDRDGKLIRTWTLPSFASLDAIDPKVRGSVVSLFLSSAVESTAIIDFNYLTGETNTPDLESSLLTKSDLRYVSEIVMVPARDGAMIPVRLTRLSSTQLNEQTPMLLQVYGGFEMPGYFYPQYSSILRDLFLDKGGVLVGPAIRGGNEYGSAWYKAAIGSKKITSLFDVIDVAKFLSEKKWTSPSRIILTGSSNGGYTAAGAALLEPKAFGLVIPVSGVYDLFALGRLDPLYAKDWAIDYGNPDILSEALAMKSHSPLEIELHPEGPLPHFLFVSGLNDTRVNPLHTLKMVKKLRLVFGESENVNAIFVKNSGHFMSSQYYEDYKALHRNLIVWDFIYQYLGW